MLVSQNRLLKKSTELTIKQSVKTSALYQLEKVHKLKAGESHIRERMSVIFILFIKLVGHITTVVENLFR